MFRYNPKANYQPNRGRYLQILSGKDLYKQTIVVSAGGHDDAFPVRFPNIFVDYPLGQMRVGDKLWTNSNKALLKLWQTQLNFAVFCASSACGVSSAHLNYTKHPMIRSVYRFHVYYHVRRILKKLHRRVDIREDIKHYQDTLSYASSKVDYSVDEHLCMLPSNMTLKIRPGTVGYNNKILVSDEKFILGKMKRLT